MASPRVNDDSHFGAQEYSLIVKFDVCVRLALNDEISLGNSTVVVFFGIYFNLSQMERIGDIGVLHQPAFCCTARAGYPLQIRVIDYFERGRRGGHGKTN